MSKFKVGDKVKFIQRYSDYEEILRGVGIITHETCDAYYITVKGKAGRVYIPKCSLGDVDELHLNVVILENK